MSESKFKVGDRVRIYGHQHCAREAFDGVVKEIHGVWLKILTDGGEQASAHPKQCRKLVKKERRRVWIHADAIKEHDADAGRGFVTGWEVHFVKPPYRTYCEFIEVRRTK